MTPHVYLNLLRMELAVQSVVHSESNFATVSDDLGFSAPSHFTRFFRDHAGVSPSEFRQVARMGSPVGP
jgi:AraC-like DNA-binding protein